MPRKDKPFDLKAVHDQLSDPTLLIKDIAAKLGFLSSSHLSRVFKRATGKSLSEYRVDNNLKGPNVVLKDTDPQWMKDAKTAVGKTETPVGAIAKEAGHSSGYSFSRVFKRLYGVNPIQYRAQERINNAKKLLETSIDPIPEISKAAGYGRLPTFFTQFKKATGLSPNQYRKRFWKAHEQKTPTSSPDLLISTIRRVATGSVSLHDVAIRHGFNNVGELRSFYKNNTKTDLHRDIESLRLSRIQKYLRRTDLEPEQFMHKVGMEFSVQIRFFFIQKMGMTMEGYRELNKVKHDTVQLTRPSGQLHHNL